MSARHHQVPRALLYSSTHSALAIVAWCLYEALQYRNAHGGQEPARARRCWVAERLGVSERTLDRARTELLTDHGGGPFLTRRLRGRNRSALHTVLHRPQETRRRYAAVPAWALARVRAGEAATADGHVCPETFRTWVVLCDKLDPDGHDLTLAKLGQWLSCSPTTARRRLRALEAAGWVRVHRRGNGFWMHVQAVVEEGLIAALPQDHNHSSDDGEEVSGCPAPSDHSPVPDVASLPLPQTSGPHVPDLTPPYETPSKEPPSEDPSAKNPFPLAVGGAQHRKDASRNALTRERQINDEPPPAPAVTRPRGGPSVMTALPLEWQLRMSQSERERVLAAIDDELAQGRTIAQLTARVRRRLTVWSGTRPRRAVAAALTVVERGYHCPHPMCEEHLLPSGHPCEACAAIGATMNRQRQLSSASSDAEEPPANSARRHAAEPRDHVRARREFPPQACTRVDADGPDGPAARARALLTSTSPGFAAADRRRHRAPASVAGATG
ncbi:hypothetical protein [Nonomuraea zeae]|uniref:Helix-turn-helix domain-containing protein n=1 Tax=Nonomuraea zeae TaxID=1642303 RepID=A0A5S4G9G3_9ACTN|nr:hypothetical protein [Nonomuraea zeae]TMR29479.1 hypothetical protein ETD85_32310 [Nonomuraea zeae]